MLKDYHPFEIYQTTCIYHMYKATNMAGWKTVRQSLKLKQIMQLFSSNSRKATSTHLQTKSEVLDRVFLIRQN